MTDKSNIHNSFACHGKTVVACLAVNPGLSIGFPIEQQRLPKLNPRRHKTSACESCRTLSPMLMMSLLLDVDAIAVHLVPVAQLTTQQNLLRHP